MNYTTPGVFVQEINSFPPSVVPVETAIPAFVGYTEQAIGPDNSDLTLEPVRISSLLDFEALFGGAFAPAAYNVRLDIPGGNAVGAVAPLDAAQTERRYYLYNALKQFYANGGGACFVVSVGTYGTAPILGNATSGLQGGVEALRSFDAPTLLVVPDAVSLSDANAGALQVTALQQCRDLQDRFAIMDLSSGNAAPAIGVDPAATFRQNVGTLNLRYGSAYYPWLRTIYDPVVHFRQMVFRDNADVLIPAGTIDGLLGTDEQALVTETRVADANVGTIVGAVDVSGWNAAPVTLSRDSFRSLSAHYTTLLDTVRATPGTPIAGMRQAFTNLLILPRALALALRTIETVPAPGLPPEVTAVVTALSTDATISAAVEALIALEKHTEIMNLVAAARAEADVNNDYSALDGSPWITTPNTGAIAADVSPLTGANTVETALNAAAALSPHMDRLAAALLAIFDAADFLAAGAETRLFDGHEVIRAARDRIVAEMTMIPPSGAVAGVYATVDRTRGVWSAPANVSLAEIVGPVVKVDDAAQGRLNVHSTGKSVNVIRAFTGKGTLIWGARTLAGNDNEWRYTQVRRFFNMAEESIKKASEPYTFEPNVAGTWVRVKAMIENFLTNQWRQGALMGSTTDKAFFVKVGLGETMTAQDILEGRMIVEIGMAVVRPAEFIILKFSHKMQES